MAFDHLIFAAYAVVFGAAALICIGASMRANRITDPGVRRGLTALLVASGLWAGFDLSILLLGPRHGGDGATVEVLFILSLVCGFAAVWAWLYFCSAYGRKALHRNRAVQALAGLFFLLVVLLKATNPLHGVYFSLAVDAAPFPHIAIRPGLLYWIVSAISYLLAAGGYLLLRPAFIAASVGWRPIIILFMLTAAPVALTGIGLGTPLLLTLNYEAVGVAAFAVGVLFLYNQYFLDVHRVCHDRPTVIVDPQDRVRSYNGAMGVDFPQFASLKGRSTPLQDVLPEVVAALQSGQDVFSVDLSANGAGGAAANRRRYYRIAQSRFGAGLESEGRLLVFTDVTIQEERRRDRDSLLRGLMESIPGVVFRLQSGPETTARLTFVNEAARHVLGIAPDEDDVLALFIERIPAAHRRQLLRTFRNATETKTSFEFEVPFRRAEEEVQWLLGEATPDMHGDAVVFTGVLIDVTERKETERDLRRSERRFRALVEQAVDVVAIFDLHGAIQYLSPSVERVTGRRRKVLVGTSAFDLAHPEDRPLLQEAFNRVAQRPGVAVEVEGRIRHGNGTDRAISIRARRVTGPGGESQVIANIRDVTDERRYKRELIAAKEAAEEASRLKSAMIANMSHEVRTPLTSILGFAEILAEGDLDDTQSRFVRMISDSGERLLRTLNAMLDLSRLEAGAADVAFEVIPAIDLVEEVVAEMRPSAQRADLSISVAPSETALDVYTDRKILRTALRNLVDNAIKFTGSGGAITVRVDPETGDSGTGERHPDAEDSSGRVVIEVEDTGIGMASSFVEEARKPFRQESVGDNREYEGSGLGLAIVDRSVRLLGGSLTIRSEKGEGTRVIIVLPASAEAGRFPTADRP